MNKDILLAIIFYFILLLLYLRFRKKFTVQGKVFVLYKTKLGLKLMDKLSKLPPRMLRIIGDLGIFAGFAGMIAMFFLLIKGAYKVIFVPDSVPLLTPVLPGISIPGLPTLSFWHWIISILVISAVHELSHGIYARFSGIKIKSSGFAFLGPILAAFVEPDERTLVKKSRREQLRIFSAGPFGNIIFFFIAFLLTGIVVAPVVLSTMEYQGIQVTSVEENSPAFKTNISAGDVILKINNREISNPAEFVYATRTLVPGEEASITTEKNVHTFRLSAHPTNSSKGYIGISVSSKGAGFSEEALNKYGKPLLDSLLWAFTLIVWMYVISFGVGLFNLLPLGMVDGGRIFYTSVLFFTKDEKKAKKIWIYTAFLCVALIVINLAPFFINLFSSIF
jgi:membrane-associated protease RseP (regulator of RpoE activity)